MIDFFERQAISVPDLSRDLPVFKIISPIKANIYGCKRPATDRKMLQFCRFYYIWFFRNLVSVPAQGHYNNGDYLGCLSTGPVNPKRSLVRGGNIPVY